MNRDNQKILLKQIILLTGLGFTTILSQLVILREFLNLFDGNELIIGLFLCAWMILSATGSSLASKPEVSKQLKSPGLILLMISCLPFLEILLIYLSEHWFFPPGADVFLLSILLICIIVLSPFCILSGMLFTMLSRDVSEISGRNRVSFAYGWESFGSIAAGILFTTGFSYLLSSYQLLGLTAALNISLYILAVNKSRTRLLHTAGVLIAAGFTVFMVTSEREMQQLHFPGQKIIIWKNTPYGNIAITSIENQYNLYLNSNPLLYTDKTFIEEPVHYALLQIKHPENVLIVSGSMQMINEALKYPSVVKADFIEINPWLIRAEQEVVKIAEDQRQNILVDDARQFIKKSAIKYDAIIVNSPDPSSAQINRYFTREFFNEAKQALKDSGIFEISLSSPGNYMNDESLLLNGIIVQTLRKEFDFVKVVPGARNYFIASNRPVSMAFSDKAEKAGIQNTYVNSLYIDDELFQQRSDEIMAQINDGRYSENSDLSPLAYYVQIGYWLKKSKGNNVVYALILLLISALFVTILLRRNPVQLGIFSSAFAGASAQFLLIFLFQVLFGNLYKMLGMIVACYMGGLFAASMISFRNPASLKKINLYVQLVLIALLFVLPAFAYLSQKTNLIPGFLVLIFFFILTTAVAFLSGLVFNIGTKLYKAPVAKTAGILYGIDLSGSAAGTLLTSMILLPLPGFLPACLIIAAMMGISALRSYGKNW